MKGDRERVRRGYERRPRRGQCGMAHAGGGKAKAGSSLGAGWLGIRRLLGGRVGYRNPIFVVTVSSQSCGLELVPHSISNFDPQKPKSL